MTEKGRILILFCNIFHDIDFTQLFYIKFAIKEILKPSKSILKICYIHCLSYFDLYDS